MPSSLSAIDLKPNRVVIRAMELLLGARKA